MSAWLSLRLAKEIMSGALAEYDRDWFGLQNWGSSVTCVLPITLHNTGKQYLGSRVSNAFIHLTGPSAWLAPVNSSETRPDVSVNVPSAMGDKRLSGSNSGPAKCRWLYMSKIFVPENGALYLEDHWICRSKRTAPLPVWIQTGSKWQPVNVIAYIY